MRIFIGTIIVLLGCLGAFGEDQDKEFPAKRFVKCTVQTSFGHDVSGGQCFSYDEVMVGIRSLDPLRIRCARLNVDCPTVRESDGTNAE